MNKWQMLHEKLLNAISKIKKGDYVDWVMELILLTLIVLVEEKINEKA